MNDDFSNLEAELKRLRPRQPSAQLRERLGAELSQSSRASTQTPIAKIDFSWRWVFWPSMAAAAILAFTVVLRQSQPREGEQAKLVAEKPAQPISSESLASSSLPKARYKPVAAERVILAAQNEGLVTLSDGTVANRVRQLSVDTYTWQDPKTKDSLRWSIPREDLRVVPASFH